MPRSGSRRSRKLRSDDRRRRELRLGSKNDSAARLLLEGLSAPCGYDVVSLSVAYATQTVEYIKIDFEFPNVETKDPTCGAKFYSARAMSKAVSYADGPPRSGLCTHHSASRGWKGLISLVAL
jgi:hypothetical protein